MSTRTYFVQECPTCGRSLQVRVEYLGRQVVCQHCHGSFEANNAADQVSNSGSAILRRANELLRDMEMRHSAN